MTTSALPFSSQIHPHQPPAMNQTLQMKDPAAGVPPQLLPHMHLVSKLRYPQSASPPLETVVSYLLEAPKIMQEMQPVQWQMLDCPNDGTSILTWQPQELGTTFASDGYVYHDQEQQFNSDVRGYNLQMYLHRAGFRPGESIATHTRRRYRLLPSQNMNMPIPDPSFWFVHYSKATQRDQIPASSIPIPPQTQAQLGQRRLIQAQGALARKEFMLRDRSNWPTINLPGGIARHAAGQAGVPPHRRGTSMSMPEPTLEEEEDVSRGDALDFMTPRDVSRMRYEQHHEWMEEILESPYATLQIVPPELGLGRKGELEAFTKDFFGAPTGVEEPHEDGRVQRVGRMDPGRAEEFTKFANEKLAVMQAELDKMKQAHEKRMDKLRKASLLTAAEKRLRTVSHEPGRKKSVPNGNSSTADAPDAIDEIVKEVEDLTGKKLGRVRNVTRIEDGGYQEISVPQPQPIERSQASMSPPKPTLPPVVQQNMPSQQPQQPSRQEPPAMQQLDGQERQPETGPLPDPVKQEQSEQIDTTDNLLQTPHGDVNEPNDDDVDMAGLDEEFPTDDQVGESNEWVMVGDQDGDNLGATPGMQSGSSHGRHDPIPDMDGAMPDLQDDGVQNQQHSTMQQQQPPTGQTPLGNDDFDMGGDFDDVNTAGDALADYNVDDLNLDNMDDSAFGDAFHPRDDHEES